MSRGKTTPLFVEVAILQKDLSENAHESPCKAIVVKFFFIKGTLSGLRQFLGTESPIKMMKNAFHFNLQALFSFW